MYQYLGAINITDKKTTLTWILTLPDCEEWDKY